jgi:GNAT superfamily N-acetyltransferase
VSVEIALGPRPGAVGAIVSLHADYYARHWGLGPIFEARTAVALGEFVERYDPNRDGLWLAIDEGRIVGSIIIDGLDYPSRPARLRLFVLDERYHGRGVGSALMRYAVEFCRAREYRHVSLFTFKGLDAARRLYDRAGFVLESEGIDEHLGKPMLEQILVWRW